MRSARQNMRSAAKGAANLLGLRTPLALPQRAHAHESGRRRRGVGGTGPRGGAQAIESGGACGGPGADTTTRPGTAN